METYIVTSRKGGIGKTSLAVQLASVFSQDGRTLLVDLDRQGDASRWVGGPDDGERLAEVLTGRIGWSEAIVATGHGLDLVPGGDRIAVAERDRDLGSLTTALSSLTQQSYEYLVVDCPPSLSSLVVAVWSAIPESIGLAPVTDPGALYAVRRLERAWSDADLDTQRIRLVQSRYDRRRILDREIRRQAREVYGPRLLQAAVRETVAVGESCGSRRPLTSYDDPHPVLEDYRRVAQELRGQEVHHG